MGRLAADPAAPGERVRAAEVIGALSLATDVGIGMSLGYGLQSTLVAMRLSERLGVDAETASQTYYACLLFYVGCTATAGVAAEMFAEDDALTTYATPGRFGSRPEMVVGMLRAVAPPDGAPLVRAVQVARGLPKLAREFKGVVAATCEVGRMLSGRLGLPAQLAALFAHVGERWDGKGDPGRAKADAVPLPVRIVHVARDAAFQRLLGGEEFAVRLVRSRAGGAFDPDTQRGLPMTRRSSWRRLTTVPHGTMCSPVSRSRACCWRVGRSIVRWRRWVISPTWSHRIWSVTRPGWRSWRRRRGSGAVWTARTW